jgi:putative peptidoglycan lipid II flippase
MPPSRPRLTRVALLLSVAVAGSRLLGYLRDAVIAARLGVSTETDAYHAAFWLPDMLYYLLAGGALSVTFVPIYNRHTTNGDSDRAWRVFTFVGALMTAVLVVATIVAYVFSRPIVGWMYPGFDEETANLTVWLTRIILPGPLLFLVGGLLTSTELGRQRFAAVALGPLVYNLCIIVFGLLLGFLGVQSFSWGVLIGAVLGPFLVPLLLSRGHVRLLPPAAETADDVRHFFRVALPLMIGASLLTVDEWLGRYFGSLVGEGVITTLNNARRLMLVPVALIGQAVAVAALPFLSRMWAEGRHEEMEKTMRRTLRSTAMLGMLASSGLALLAQPFVRIVYERGAFTAEWSATTVEVLRILSAGVVGFCLQSVALRGFYAREHTLAPMIVTTLAVIATIPVYAVLGDELGANGLAWASVIGVTASAAATLLLYDIRYGQRTFGVVTVGLGAGLLLSAVASVAGFSTRWFLDRSLSTDTFAGALTTALVAGGIYTVVALAGASQLDDTIRERTFSLLRRIPGMAHRLPPPPPMPTTADEDLTSAATSDVDDATTEAPPAPAASTQPEASSEPSEASADSESAAPLPSEPASSNDPAEPPAPPQNPPASEDAP